MFDNILLAGGDSFTAPLLTQTLLGQLLQKDWNAKVYSVAEMAVIMN